MRLLRGDYDRVEVDAGDPLELVRRAAQAGPPLVHVVALAAARDGGAPIELASAVVAAAAPVPVQLGGGVRSVVDAELLVRAGVARVVVGTAAFGDAPLHEFVDAIGDRLAVGVPRSCGYRRSRSSIDSSRTGWRARTASGAGKDSATANRRKWAATAVS